MNITDLACLAILLVSAVFGLARGFAREVLGLAAWIGAGVGAVLAFPLLAPPLRGLIANRSAADASAWARGFIVLLVVLLVLADLLARVVRATPLGGLDRLLGIAFGLVRGAAILIGAYVLAGLVVPPAQWPVQIRSARATPIAYEGAAWAVSMIPPGARPPVAPPGAPPTIAPPGAPPPVAPPSDGSAVAPPGTRTDLPAKATQDTPVPVRAAPTPG